MKRYNLMAKLRQAQHNMSVINEIVETEDSNGKWVKWEDVEKYLKSLQTDDLKCHKKKCYY